MTKADTQSQPAHVAFFTPAPTFGGAQRVTVTISNSLAKRGYRVDLVTGWLEGEFASEIHDTVNTVDLDVQEVPGAGIMASVPKLTSYLNAQQPALLFASRRHTNLAAITAGHLSRADSHVAVTEHAPFNHQPEIQDKVTTTLASKLYTYADDVIAVSEGLSKSVVENTNVAMDGTTVINNPIDLKAIQTDVKDSTGHDWLNNSSTDTIVAAGRLEHEKGFDTLLEAFATVQASRPSARLIIIGEGSQRESLLSLARRLGVERQVSLPGYADNPFAYMSDSDVFVLSSRLEGLPTVLIEALACGCSIVATDCQYGPREILSDGKYGRLTPVDDADQMAARIETALNDPFPAQRARSRAEDFSMEVGADRYEAYIQNVVENR